MQVTLKTVENASCNIQVRGHVTLNLNFFRILVLNLRHKPCRLEEARAYER